MKWLKFFGGVAYLASFIVALNAFFNLGFSINDRESIYLFIVLGGIGFLLNLVSYKKDKIGNQKTNLLFWVGGFCIFFGLTLKILYLKFSTPLILLGIAAITLSILFFSKKLKNKKRDEDILDQR
jgi:hypothetical protein